MTCVLWVCPQSTYYMEGNSGHKVFHTHFGREGEGGGGPDEGVTPLQVALL